MHITFSVLRWNNFQPFPVLLLLWQAKAYKGAGEKLQKLVFVVVVQLWHSLSVCLCERVFVFIVCAHLSHWLFITTLVKGLSA